MKAIITKILFILPLAVTQVLFAQPNAIDLSLEELGNVSIDSPSTLTSVAEKDLPSNITTITSKQIQETGARSLDELLEWHVPGYQRHAQSSNSYTVSNRGIVGQGRFLLVVNGKTMNDHSQHQAVMERDLTSMGDIAEIQVIRGSSAAIYGHGAFSMVVSIKTHNSRTFEGTKIKVSGGITEEFLHGELTTAYKWAIDQGVFFYAGVTDYKGADIDDAPVFFGVEGTPYQGQKVSANDTSSYAIANDYQNAGDKPAIKLHGQIDWGDISAWMRYTKGGKRFTRNINTYEKLPYSITKQNEIAYEQATINLDYKKYFKNNWMVAFSGGYDSTEGMRRQSFSLKLGALDEAYREDQLLAKLLIRNDSFDNHSFAIGGEYSFERFGLVPHHISNSPVKYASYKVNLKKGFRIEPWEAVTLTGFAEHQWRLSPQFIILSNLRVDLRDHIKTLFSPRLSLTYHLTDQDSFHLMASRSNKIPDAPVIERQMNEGGDDFKPTINDSLEFRWNRVWGNSITSSISLYGQQREFIGWDSSKQQDAPVGKVRQWGLEFDFGFHGGDLDISFSHQFNKLIELKLNDPDSISLVSVQPNGFGNDLITVHNNISKLNLRYQFIDGVSGLLTYIRYWGTPGTADFHDFFNHRLANATHTGPGVRARDNVDRYEFSEATDYLHLSINWKILKNTQLGFHGNYLLGFIDKKLNKRGFSQFGYYRTHAPAFSVQLSYAF